MKRIVFFLTMVAGTAFAQDKPLRENFRSQLSTSDKEIVSAIRVEKPNQVITQKRAYSGIAVQVVKTRNPLQLINPFAPAEYGSGEQNLVPGRDEVTGRPTGLAILTASVGH